jgi:AcrR family transcriptional regulator
MSRRERLREFTREEIKGHARQQMADSGTAALSLGAIARAMEMVPSALYRYYASRDGLITALIVDAFNDLADTLQSAAANRPADDFAGRLFDTSLAYRTWALDHPVDFQLVFGNPIPGYEAPAGLTIPAAQRVFSAFLNIMQAAYDAGAFHPLPEHERQGVALIRVGPSPADSEPIPIVPVVRYAGIACWTKIHGMVVLELIGHLQPALGDTAAFYRDELTLLLQQVGF